MLSRKKIEKRYLPEGLSPQPERSKQTRTEHERPCQLPRLRRQTACQEHLWPYRCLEMWGQRKGAEIHPHQQRFGDYLRSPLWHRLRRFRLGSRHSRFRNLAGLLPRFETRWLYGGVRIIADFARTDNAARKDWLHHLRSAGLGVPQWYPCLPTNRRRTPRAREACARRHHPCDEADSGEDNEGSS